MEQLWIIDVYALVLSGLLVTAGALGDRWGRKRLLLIGFALFAAASLGAVAATEAWHVIAARALLGVGGAAIMPTTLSILRHVFTDARERAFAYAVWAAVMGGGMALGPVVGGLLVEGYGWQSAFLLNIPIALTVIVLGAWLLPESFAPRAGRWDWTGVAQSVVGMIALAAGIKQLGKSGLTAPLPWVLLALAAIVLTLFVRRQLRLAHPCCMCACSPAAPSASRPQSSSWAWSPSARYCSCSRSGSSTRRATRLSRRDCGCCPHPWHWWSPPCSPRPSCVPSRSVMSWHPAWS